MELYEIISIKTNNFALGGPISESTTELINSTTTNPITHSKYKLKHKLYNIILPHEFVEVNSETIQIFINKYKKRIKRFYELNQANTKLIFIRLGINDEIQHLNELSNLINIKFNYSINEIKFINSTILSKNIKTSDWTRSEYEWNKILNLT